MLGHHLDDPVGQLRHVAGTHVVPAAVAVGRVEHLLVVDVGLGPEQVQHGGAERPHRGEHTLALLDVAGVAAGHRDDGLADKVGRNRRERRRQPLDHDRRQVVRALGDPVAVEAEHPLGLLDRPEHRAPHDLRTQLDQPELERRHHAEVAAATPQRPEQVGVLVVAGVDEIALRRHQVHAGELVDREPVSTHDPPDAATEGEAGEPGVGHDASRDGEPVLLGRQVDLAEQHPRLGVRGPLLRVHLDLVHRTQVDQHPVVARGQTREAVSTATQRDGQVVLAAEPDRRADVVDTGAPDDDLRTPVDGAVPHLTVRLVPRIGLRDDLTADRSPQVLEGAGIRPRGRRGCRDSVSRHATQCPPGPAGCPPPLGPPRQSEG